MEPLSLLISQLRTLLLFLLLVGHELDTDFYYMSGGKKGRVSIIGFGDPSPETMELIVL